jgi:hypothetical protein
MHKSNNFDDIPMYFTTRLPWLWAQQKPACYLIRPLQQCLLLPPQLLPQCEERLWINPGMIMLPSTYLRRSLRYQLGGPDWDSRARRSKKDAD